MKLILALLTIAFFSVPCFSNVTADNEYLLNHDGAIGQKAQLGTLVNKTRNLLVARYSYAVQGGTSVTAIDLIRNLGDKKSYATLPTGAIITNVWLESLTAPGSGNTTTTMAVYAVTSTGDLFASGATTSTPFRVGFSQGIPTGATSTFIKLSSAKTIKLKVGVAPLIAGKFNVYIEYVLGGTTN